MLFTRKKKEEIRDEIAVKEEKKSLFIGTPEMTREVKYNITSAEAYAMFEKWRQPEKEIFAEALKMARDKSVSLIILDLMLPKIDGLTVCQKVREFSQVPIIMLTAKTEDMDKILGL